MKINPKKNNRGVMINIIEIGAGQEIDIEMIENIRMIETIKEIIMITE
jgi:hypothetical protein